jgi:hypothetical protein
LSSSSALATRASTANKAIGTGVRATHLHCIEQVQPHVRDASRL